MGVDSITYDLRIDPDARLAAAAGGVARYLAESSGLASEAVSELQKAVIAVCNDAFASLSGEHPNLNVSITRYLDRMEVTVASRGSAGPAMGLDHIAGFASQGGGPVSLSGIDRVQYEIHEGSAVTRLTKYFGHAPRMA